MRISHAQLETCRANPAAWLAARAAPSASGPRWGYARVTKLAVYRFHRTADVTDAQQYLRRLLDKVGVANAQRVASAERELDAYITWFNGARRPVADYKVNISLDLGRNWILGGEVSRVDLDLARGGYSAILLGETNPSWKTEVRMPLIQIAIARRLSRAESDIMIGVQNLDGSDLRATAYSTGQRKKALTTAQGLARRLGGLEKK